MDRRSLMCETWATDEYITTEHILNPSACFGIFEVTSATGRCQHYDIEGEMGQKKVVRSGRYFTIRCGFLLRGRTLDYGRIPILNL